MFNIDHTSITIWSRKHVHRRISVTAATSVFIDEHRKRMVRWLILASLTSVVFISILAYILVPNPPDPSTIDSSQAAQSSHP